MAIGVDFRTFSASKFQAARREGRRTKTRVGRSLTCCNEESIKVLGLQSGVGGDQRRPRLAHKAQRGTAVPSRAGTYSASRTAWSWRVAERPTCRVRVHRFSSPVQLAISVRNDNINAFQSESADFASGSVPPPNALDQTTSHGVRLVPPSVELDETHLSSLNVSYSSIIWKHDVILETGST